MAPDGPATDRWFYLYWEGPAEFCPLRELRSALWLGMELPDCWCRVSYEDMIPTVHAPLGDYPYWVLDDVCRIVGAGEAH